MKQDARLELIKRNAVEVVTEPELEKLLEKKRITAYCGYEPSGPMHLGHFITVLKLMDLAKAGIKTKILLADVHAFLNKKGDEEEIRMQVKNWEKTIKSIGLKAEKVLGSKFQFSKEYQTDLLKLSLKTTLNRGLRSMQEIARDPKNATVSQVIYPLMQVLDIKYMNLDIAVGGMEQRKVHMIGKDMKDVTGHNFVAIHTPLVSSLVGEGKMSKSVEGSFISVTDTTEEINRKISKAYCPTKQVNNNPILEISKIILFPRFGIIRINRPEKFGGEIVLNTYPELEKTFSKGELHPADLKKSVAEQLDEIIQPIRNSWK